MIKKSTLVLSTVGILSLATVGASRLAACDFASNCTGYYYEDINSAFLDCFDMNGVLVSRKEGFYSSPLEKECNSTDSDSWGAMMGENMTSPMANSTANETANATMVGYCDYFSFGEGYQFTQADSGIGLVYLADRVNASRDLYYKNGAPTPVPLAWNWAELTTLIQSLANAQCSQANVTAGVPAAPSGVLPGLNLPWAQWSLNASGSLNVSTWTKAEWKFWLENYVMYFNALQAYISVGKNALNNAQVVAGGILANYGGDIAASVAQAEQLLSGAQLVLGNVNVDGSVVFSQIWRPDFDLESVTIGEILADISLASNVVSQVQTWFSTFFVNGGLDAVFGQNTTISIEGGSMTTNISSGFSSDNSLVLNVPANVQAVVAWITANFRAEIQALFPQYNFVFSSGATYIAVEGNATEGNSTLPDGSGSGDNSTIDNSTGEGNTTDNSTGSIPDNSTLPDNSTGNSSINATFSWAVNYSLPEGCSYVTSDNDTVECSSGNSRGVSYSFAEINEYWDLSALNSCADAQDTLGKCQSQTTIADLETCLRLSYFNTFQLSQNTRMYGWLSYDAVARNALFGRCQSESNGFNVTSDQFSAAFQFDFPNM